MRVAHICFRHVLPVITSLFLCVAGLWAGQPVSPVAKEKVTARLRPPAPGDVQLNGYLGGKIDLCIRNRVLAQEAGPLIEPFCHREETRCWQTEFWGKWFTSLALAYHYQPGTSMKSLMDSAVRGLAATQTADGYIGNYRPESHLEQWDIWGRKYCLLGLLAHYEATGDSLALASARRLASHLLTETGPGRADIVRTGNHRGMPSCSVLEPMVALYRYTEDRRYLDFAEWIVERIESAEGPQLLAKALAGIPVAERFPRPENWWGWGNGMKAYEMMSCYEGLCELHRVTGRKEYLQAAVMAWENIRDTEINVSGGGSSLECWYGGARLQATPALHSMETCVSVTWLRFSARLLALTGEPCYAEAVEQTLYNTLLGAMSPDGSDFAKYSPLAGQRSPGDSQCGMPLHCCNANGPRGLLLVPQLAVMASDSGPVVNLYCAGRAVVSLPSGNRVEIEQETGYPFDGTVTIRIKPSRPERFSLRLRIPSWSERTALDPGSAVVADPVVPGQYAVLTKLWQAGDSVRISLDMRGRVVRDSSGLNFAVLRGPLVLARDSRLEDSGGSVDATIQRPEEKDGFIELTPDSTAKGNEFRLILGAPVIGDPASRDSGPSQVIRLCDYASAGGWNTGARFRVWLPLLLDISKRRTGP